MKSISKCAFTLNAIYKIKIDHTKESCSSVINIVLFIILLTNGSRINAQTMDVWDDRTSICAHR